MKIIILGAGQVGTTLAEYLTSEDNDITVIDISRSQLQRLEERLDIRTLVGCASYPNMLVKAGAADADMLIAVTSNDETNMIVCQIAHHLFNIPTKMARIRSAQYLAYKALFGKDGMAIDVVISPEQEVTNHVRRLIEYPDALQVHSFAERKVFLVGVKAKQGGSVVDCEVRNIFTELLDLNANLAAVFRGGEALTLNEEIVIKPGDEVYFLSKRKTIRSVMAKFRGLESSNKNIMLAGGGNIGTKLAFALENDYKVKVIEHNKDRIVDLATRLKTAIILEGDAADRDLLLSEDIQDVDVFCAVTNSDETNILAALVAKNLGAKKVMALNNRSAYIDVIDNTDIDVGILPSQVTVGILLTHIRRGDVVKAYSLRKGKSEAIEAIAHGDKNSSQVVGRKVADIPLPEGVVVGAVVRGDEFLMQMEEIEIQAEDHLIFFLTNKDEITAVESLFQVED